MTMKREKENGYLTVYLALVLTIMLSLYLVLIEGVRSNAIRLEAECVADIGLNSVLAEYHRELLNRYNLFAVDSSYGTAHAGSSNVEQHLQNYMNRNFSVEDVFLSEFLYKDFLALEVESANVTKVSILTDGQGEVFRKRAVEAVKDDVGLTMLETLRDWLEVVTSNGLNERVISAEKEALDEQLAARDGEMVQIEKQVDEAERTVEAKPNSESKQAEAEQQKDGAEKSEEIQQKYETDQAGGTEEMQHERESQLSEETEAEIKEFEWVAVDIVNPTEGLEQVRRLGILSSVVEEAASLSAKRISEETLISTRMANDTVSRGNYPLEETEKLEEFTERFFFQEYLLRYMGSYVDVPKNTALDYQIEYLIAGKETDGDNLRAIANRLCALREVANTIYLYADTVKCAEAEALAAVLATLCFLPELTEVFKHTLLLGWAYAESVHDVKVLLAGGNVPLLKDDASWYYDLETALSLGEKGDSEANGTSGLSYEDYLRILMSFTNLDTLTARAMNMVEADIRLSRGNEHFRLDACYERFEFNINVTSAYGYQYEIKRRKSYGF